LINSDQITLSIFIKASEMLIKHLIVLSLIIYLLLHVSGLIRKRTQ